MFKIINKINVTGDVYIIEVEAPRVAKSILPGQFVIIRADEKGERTPFPVCDFDIKKGIVSVVFKAIGSTAMELLKLEANDTIMNILGPIGQASYITSKDSDNLKNVLFVADDLGFARIYPELLWLDKKDISSDVIINFQSNEEIKFKEKIVEVSRELIEVKDDIIDELKKTLNKGVEYDLVIAMGSTEMMREVSLITKEHNIKTIVSLTTLILDGTGMCGACRITANGDVKFVCQDGPEFDAWTIDYEEVLRRQKFYSSFEAKEKYRRENDKKNEAAAGLEVE
jgi:NAD(P)H-flavin reductase